MKKMWDLSLADFENSREDAVICLAHFDAYSFVAKIHIAEGSITYVISNLQWKYYDMAFHTLEDAIKMWNGLAHEYNLKEEGDDPSRTE